MAARITSEILETGILSDAAPKIRITSEILETGILSDAQPKIRVTSVILEIGIDTDSHTFSDTLNNWSDGIVVNLGSGGLLTQVFNDDLNQWSDSVLVTRGDVPIFVNLQDSIYNFADEFSGSPDFLVNAYDTLQRWIDAINYYMNMTPIGVSDSLNNWRDNTNQSLNAFGTDAGDNFNLNDVIKLQLAYLVGVADSFNLTDSPQAGFSNYGVAVWDIMQQLDSLVIGYILNYDVSVSDQMVLTDNLPEGSLIERDTNYLRRYLNDVIFRA